VINIKRGDFDTGPIG